MARVSIRGHQAVQKVQKHGQFLNERALMSKESLSYFILEYLKWMQMQNYSEITIGNRKRYLAYFAIWALAQGVEEIKAVTRKLLEDYRKYLFEFKKKNGQNLSMRSQWTRLEPLRAFFSWMTRKYHILYNPASELDLPKLGSSLPSNILTDKQVNKILNSPNLKRRRGIRDRAILELFYSTGIRRLELIHLSIYDINFERTTMLIRQGKWNKDRVVPIGQGAMYWARKYLEDVRPHFINTPTDTLFLTNAGDPLKAPYLTWKVREYIEKAGVAVDGACHIFRHSMATLMLENGADIRYIQEMLGHAKLETTQIYTRVSIEKLKEVHARTHPAEQK